MNDPTPSEIHAAVDRLNQSTVGRTAMNFVPPFIDHGATKLDETQQADVVTLMHGMWGELPTLTRHAIREALVERARR